MKRGFCAASPLEMRPRAPAPRPLKKAPEIEGKICPRRAAHRQSRPSEKRSLLCGGARPAQLVSERRGQTRSFGADVGYSNPSRRQSGQSTEEADGRTRGREQACRECNLGHYHDRPQKKAGMPVLVSTVMTMTCHNNEGLGTIAQRMMILPCAAGDGALSTKI